MPSGIKPWLLGYVAEQAQPEQVAIWANRITGAILTEVPDARRLDDAEELLRITVREHWVAFLDDFAQPTQHFHLVHAAERLAVLVAELQIPLETLTQIYRVAQQEVWAYVREVIMSLPPSDVDRADLLVHFWNRAGVWLDKSTDASVAIYQDARSRVLAGAAARRFESARAILAGEVVDPREASAALGGYPLSVHHTAFVLSVDDPEHAGNLEALANDLVSAVGGTKPLLVKPGGRQLWMWVATRDPLDLTAVREATVGMKRDGICVGVGASDSGVAGFGASHREALGALQVTATSGHWLASYIEVELPVLLGCTPDVDRFMTRQLGSLVADDESTERIRETLTAFLASGGSVEETARALVVHRNTVRYRLSQAEETIGRPITKISPDLAVALRHHALFHGRGVS